jgi:hypothetical protein
MGGGIGAEVGPPHPPFCFLLRRRRVTFLLDLERLLVRFFVGLVLFKKLKSEVNEAII